MHRGAPMPLLGRAKHGLWKGEITPSRDCVFLPCNAMGLHAFAFRGDESVRQSRLYAVYPYIVYNVDR
jgi:hypothetical protein